MARYRRQARAAAVSVGLEVPMVGMLPAPTRYRLPWFQHCCRGSTTELAAEWPIRWVPPRCPAPRYSTRSPRRSGAGHRLVARVVVGRGDAELGEHCLRHSRAAAMAAGV